MTELKHWLAETSDADEFERSILRVGLSADPPAGAEDAVWANVLAAVAVVPIAAVTGGAPSVVGGASKALGVCLGVGKGFVVGLALYGVVGVVAGAPELATRFTSQPAAPVRVAPKSAARAVLPLAAHSLGVPPEPTPDSSATAPSASAAYATRAPVALPSAPAASAGISSVAAFSPPDSAPRPSQLQAEAAALRSARAELRAGQLADAFATLEASRRQFSAPELYQERESLMIELLFRSGQSAIAKQRAEAFLVGFPDSPHAGSIRQLTERQSSR